MATKPSAFRFKDGDMSPRLSITAHPKVKVITRDLDRFAGDIRSFREPLNKSIREVMAPSFRKNFDVGGRPERWDPIKPATATHPKRGSQGGPLVASGRLRDVASSPTIWNVDVTSATIEGLPAAVRYGVAHQKGYTFTAGKTNIVDVAVPARPFLVIQDEDERKVEDIFFNWIEDRARRAGFRRSY